MKYLSKILLFILAISFSTYAQDNPNDDAIGNPCCCSGAACNSSAFLIRIGTQVPPFQQFPKRIILGFGYAKNSGNYSQQYTVEYTRSDAKVRGVTLNYEKIVLPAVIYWNPSNHISVGGGLQAEMLLSANEAGKKVDINNDNFKKYGLGIVSGVEIGAKNRGPRLGINYVHHFGAGSSQVKSFGTLEISLKVQIGKKP